MDWLTMAVLAVLVVSAVGFGWRRHPLAQAALTAVAVLVCSWALVAAAVFTGWGDADGFIDCNRNCTPLQDASGVLFVLAPITAALLALLALIMWLRSRSPRR